MRQWVRTRQFSGILGLSICICLVVVAVFAPLLTPYHPNDQVLADGNMPPFWVDGGHLAHPLGTDRLGRDLASRIMYGARISLIVGLATVLIQTVIGVSLGLLAGFRGGWVDTIIMRLADVWLAIPFLVLAIAVAVVLGPGLTNTVLVLSVIGWVTYARVVRAEVLAVRERDAVVAARALGAGPLRLVMRHILPNVAASIIVVGTLEVSRMILAEASLSFLGLGVQPPQAAWGSMLAEGRTYLSSQWWLATIPGIALLITTLGINLFGDALRDSMDPTLK